VLNGGYNSCTIMPARMAKMMAATSRFQPFSKKEGGLSPFASLQHGFMIVRLNQRRAAEPVFTDPANTASSMKLLPN